MRRGERILAILSDPEQPANMQADDPSIQPSICVFPDALFHEYIYIYESK